MDLQQSKLLLEKINTLFKNFQQGGDPISLIEKDLMLQYIRDLYEHMSRQITAPRDMAQPSVRSQPAEKQQVVVTAPPTATLRVPEIETPTEFVSEEEPEPEAIEEWTLPSTTALVREEPRPEQVATPEPQPVQQPQPQPEPEPQPQPKPVEMPTPQVVFTTDEADTYDALIDHPDAVPSSNFTDLPIADLHKAMGINERMFTVNELFSGNSQAFSEGMDQLNACSSVQDARPVLLRLAQRFDWYAPSREKKARNFIRLIKRRFK